MLCKVSSIYSKRKNDGPYILIFSIFFQTARRKSREEEIDSRSRCTEIGKLNVKQKCESTVMRNFVRVCNLYIFMRILYKFALGDNHYL